MNSMKAALFLACFALCGAAVAGSPATAVAGVQRSTQNPSTSSGGETSFRITNIRTAPGAPSSSLLPQPILEKKGGKPNTGTAQEYMHLRMNSVFISSSSF